MIIAMAGLPGTGKSAIASRLRQELGAMVFDKDRIRAALFAPDHIAYSTEQDDFCQSLMLEATAYVLRADRTQPVILDGRTFSRQYQVASLDRFAALHAIPLIMIQCVCSDVSARERLAHDSGAGTHLAANRDFALYLAIKARYETIREPKLVLNTDHDLDVCVAQARAYLDQHGLIDGGAAIGRLHA